MGGGQLLSTLESEPALLAFMVLVKKYMLRDLIMLSLTTSVMLGNEKFRKLQISHTALL